MIAHETSTTVTPPAVIVGGIGCTISMARSLGRAGIPVHVLGAGGASLAGSSRYCDSAIDVEAGPGVIERWLEWLERSGPRGAVVLPSGDEGLELIVRHGARLSQLGYRLPDTAGDVSLAMLDKAQTYELARAADIPCPNTWTVRSAEEVRALAGVVRYPCALKPVHSHLFSKHFAVKVLVAHSEQELSESLSKTNALGLEMLVTEIIPGADDRTWSYSTHIDADGSPQFEITRNKLRAFPIHFGTNCYVETRWNPDVAEVGLRFLQSIGLRGLAHVEFKWDERDGLFKLIECNHRFVNPQEVLRRAGLDIALFVYRRALGEHGMRMDRWREGVRLWFPERDVKAAMHYRRSGALTWLQWLRSLAHWPVYTPVLTFDDPMPTVASGLQRARGRGSRVLGDLTAARRPTARRLAQAMSRQGSDEAPSARQSSHPDTAADSPVAPTLRSGRFTRSEPGGQRSGTRRFWKAARLK